MRNLKKFLALVLAMIMVVSAGAAVSAFTDIDDSQYADAINKLAEYGIVNGTDPELGINGKFDPTDKVNRMQMAIMMARALNPNEKDALADGMKIFDDVTEWYGAIAYAFMNNIVTGIGNNLFAPYEGIKYQDALIMAVRALGYTVDVSGTPYWLAAFGQAQKLGLTKNVAVNDGDQTLNRAECAQIIANMITATPANGGATIEAKNFGLATPDNSTTFVITATSKQGYTGDKVIDKDFVALQTLSEDGKLGDKVFVEFNRLGFGEDVTADDVIGYSVNLVNCEIKGQRDVEFDDVVLGTADVYTNKDIKVDGAKITVDGKVYTMVKEQTGNVLRNEIVVLDETGTITGTSQFYYNKKGDIVNKDGSKILAYKLDATNAKGESLYALAADYEKDSFIAKTIDELGDLKVVNGSTADGFTPVEKLSGAYQITMFKDNNSEYYTRAIMTPIAVSVYKEAKKENNQMVEKTIGLFENKPNVTFDDPSVKVKGTVFVYTYNKQTNTVHVIDTVEKEIGTITKFDLSGVGDGKVAVYIDGEKYLVGADKFTADMGAKLYKTGDNVAFTEIAKDAKLSYIDGVAIAKAESYNKPIEFYAYNGYIINARVTNPVDNFEYVVMKEPVTFDNDVLVADMYLGGKLVNDVRISEFKGQVLDELSQPRFLKAVSDFFEAKEGTVYKAIKLGDGTYSLMKELNTTDNANVADFKLFKADGVAVSNKVEFNNGISSNDNKTLRIRSNANTAFYFIDKDGVKAFVGTPDESIITVDTATKIYVTKLGYGSDSENAKNGVTSIVLVYNAKTIEGFGITATADVSVYVPKTTNKVVIDTAANFGLTGYTGNYYYYADIAINLSNGAKVSVYSKAPLKDATFYKLDANGVVVADKAVATTTKTVVKDMVDLNDQYITVKGVFDTTDKVSKIVSVKDDELKIESGSDAKKTIEAGKSITFIENDLKDGIFVVVVNAKDAEKPTDGKTVIANAKWTGPSGNEYAAVADVKATKTTISGTAYVVTVDGKPVGFDNYKDEIANATPWTGLTETAYHDASIVVVKKGDTEAIDFVKPDVKVTIKDGIATIDFKSIADTSDLFGNATELANGDYKVTISFAGEEGHIPSFEFAVKVG